MLKLSNSNFSFILNIPPTWFYAQFMHPMYKNVALKEATAESSILNIIACK